VKDHFATQYIGIRWKLLGRTTKGFECWGLVMHVLKEHFDLDVGTVAADGRRAMETGRAFLKMMPEAKGSLMAAWERVEHPAEGDIVVMCNRNEVPGHCGIYIEADGGGVLHCAEKAGVVIQKVAAIEWPVIKFYRYKG
jgi:cell wall-associated NlpC family hydrolase